MYCSQYFVGLKSFGLACASLALFVGCGSQGAKRGDMNTHISISYAVVEHVEQVKLESEAGKAAAIGGLWGAVGNSGRYSSSGDAARGAVRGAILMGGTTKIAEGSNTAYSYTLRGADGKVFKAMTDQSGIAVGDCVSVEQGNHLNVRRVSSAYCEGDQPISDPEVHNEIKNDAQACEKAKQGLLAAPEEEISAWAKKVRALCDD